MSRSLFHGVAEQIADLLEKKNSDYGSSYDQTRKEFGFNSFLIRITDKINRLKSLTMNKNEKEQQVTDESIEDTIRDIAGFSILELVLREKEKENLHFKSINKNNDMFVLCKEDLKKDSLTEFFMLQDPNYPLAVDADEPEPEPTNSMSSKEICEIFRDDVLKEMNRYFALVVDQNSRLEEYIEEIKIKVNALMLHRKTGKEIEKLSKDIEEYKQLLIAVKRYLVVTKNCPDASIEDIKYVETDLIDNFKYLYEKYYRENLCEL